MLKKNSSVEDQANAVEQQRNRGSKVVYGQPIQLRHQFTGKYIHFSKKEMAELATKTMRVELQAYNAKQAQFRIMPRYKVRSEGDVVCIGDQVVLESFKSHGQYISVSEDVFPEDSVYAFRHEINFSVVHSTFTVYRQACAYDAQKEYLTPNGCVRFFHKEIDAYICAEGQFNDSVMQDVHLRVRGIDYSIPKTVFPSTSAITYWQIEAKNSMFPGGFLQWETPVRFQHMITQLYLTVKKDGKYTLTLTDDRNDTGTVFKLYPVVKKNEPIPKGSYCRIKHVITGYWMQALQGVSFILRRKTDLHQHNAIPEEVPRETLVQGTSTAFSDIEWTTAVMKKVGLSEQMMFADAFTIQNVEPENLTNFSFMCGYIPLLQNLIQYALKELEAWMFIDGRPIKKRQKLVRNLLGIRSMVTLLQAKWECVPYRSTMIMVQIYCVLNAYLKGDSRKNELWLARHNVFFLHQISLKGPVGQRATIMLTELLDGNRKVIDRMSEKQVDYIIELLAENMDYRYLDLLGVLCVCQDVAIRRHQKYIAEAWLKSTKKPIYDTKVGQAIGEDSNVIYVSTNRKTWTSLNEFTNKVGGTSEEQLKFLHSQLNLMSKICQNRNEMAIQILTAELKYLTWDEAMLCLTNPELPDDLRAQYCKLIIVLFVDVPGNISTAEDVLMTMEYDNIVTNNMRSDSEKILDKVVDSGELNTHLEQLKRWIMEFLSENRFMVLRLVYLLVTYCCYDTKVALREVLEPLLGILDGGTSATEEEMELFHSSGRYQMSLENNAVIDAKYQAIDLVLNIRFNNRLEAFAGLFKEVHSMKDHDHPLSPIISGNFEESSISRYRDDVMDRLGEIVDNTAILQPGVLVDILSDISAYKYDNLVMKATHLLVRYYSAFENLLSRAITAKILVNDESLKNLKKVRNRIPLLSLVVNSAINPDNAQKICPLLDELIRNFVQVTLVALARHQC
ncbi:hypothetical protein CAPTEDRAFT_189051 [Capitella teleta]|uniref:Inositol 1,4,5-trisphosphate receptor n=1 Tax=Capitella teleta TaxID=283909 RepID=R7UUS8_CAPTE|nr:hypothetical protein CAPTEDRAFT_189051 [Capitella teleta]|eukprot:ELU07682.1 hypothetical protein CAPTEDRAFT_189051 [Capitella teleta]